MQESLPLTLTTFGCLVARHVSVVGSGMYLIMGKFLLPLLGLTGTITPPLLCFRITGDVQGSPQSGYHAALPLQVETIKLWIL